MKTKKTTQKSSAVRKNNQAPKSQVRPAKGKYYPRSGKVLAKAIATHWGSEQAFYDAMKKTVMEKFGDDDAFAHDCLTETRERFENGHRRILSSNTKNQKSTANFLALNYRSVRSNIFKKQESESLGDKLPDYCFKRIRARYGNSEKRKGTSWDKALDLIEEVESYLRNEIPQLLAGKSARGFNSSSQSNSPSSTQLTKEQCEEALKVLAAFRATASNHQDNPELRDPDLRTVMAGKLGLSPIDLESTITRVGSLLSNLIKSLDQTGYEFEEDRDVPTLVYQEPGKDPVYYMKTADSKRKVHKISSKKMAEAVTFHLQIFLKPKQHKNSNWW